MRVWARWVLGVLVAAAVVGVPTAYYRSTYAHAKRLRVVADGKLIRCGQLTANGFEDAFRRYGIKLVVNLREETPKEEDAEDPLLPLSWGGRPTIRESAVCQKNGVRYVQLDGGVLEPQPGQPPGARPLVIDQFLEIMDDPANHPVLIHCQAGLHRTGLLTAVYRMEYEKRSKADAVRELQANGFGTFAATEGNVYLVRFITEFEPGIRRGSQAKRGGK